MSGAGGLSTPEVIAPLALREPQGERDGTGCVITVGGGYEGFPR